MKKICLAVLLCTLNVFLFFFSKVRQVCYAIAGGIQPIQNLSVLKYVGDEKKAEWGHYWINKGFHSKFLFF